VSLSLFFFLSFVRRETKTSDYVDDNLMVIER
jgi:hypothetical protein